jgi:hypothetical protein
MPKSQNVSTSPDPADGADSSNGDSADASACSPAIGKLLSRWADAVANGEAQIPEEITPEDRQRLVAEVRRRRRARLVQYIARAIAQDILRSRGQQHGDSPSC